MNQFTYRTATVCTQAHMEVSSANVSGIVTPETLRLIIADSTQWAGGKSHLAHAVDYSAATMALDLDQMVQMARAAKRQDALNATPAALIVSADQLCLFDSYAAFMQRIGYTVAVFTAGDAARRWCAQQALVREHWRGLRAELRRSAP